MIGLLGANLEHDLDGTSATGSASMSKRLFKPSNRIPSRNEGAEAMVGDQLGGEVKGGNPDAIYVLRAVGIGPDELDLSLPETCQIHRDLAGHADDHDASSWSDDREGLLERLL